MLCACAVFLAGCTTPVPERVPVPEAPESVAPQSVPPAQPEAAPAEEPKQQNDEYQVSPEVYEKTFDEVSNTINRLNEIIREQDFQSWKSFLTPAYVAKYSDPQTLKEISLTPILQRNKITLTTLEDYFTWVVVPSRANARLDDLRFLSDDKVEAIMEVKGRAVILYQLRHVDNRWKVDVF